MSRARQWIKGILLLAAWVFTGSLPALAGNLPNGITWQDYTKATAAAKKANRPVLVDFWRPG